MAIAAVLLAFMASVIFIFAACAFGDNEPGAGIVVGFLGLAALSVALVMAAVIETRPGGVFGPPVGVAGRK